MLVEFFHVVASGTEVFAGVEFSGLFSEDAADSGGHSETAVAVDVDFANGACGCFAELFFGDTDCVGKFATEFVDGVNFVLGHGRRAVEHDGEAGEFFHNGVEHIESQWRGHEVTFGVAGALFGGELVSAVRSADGDSEGVATGACSEVYIGYEIKYYFGTNVE